MIVYVPLPPPLPMVGSGEVQGPTCSTFSTLELYQIKSLCLFGFSLLAFLATFFHTQFSMLAMAPIITAVSFIEHSNCRSLELKPRTKLQIPVLEV